MRDRAPVVRPADRLTRFAGLVGSLIPDAMSTSIALPVLVAASALAMGSSAGETMGAYYRGLWMLLPFTMQMTLILVLSSSVGTMSDLARRRPTTVVAVGNGECPHFGYDRGMAQQASFDITSTVDLQEVDNAVNQAIKELAQRYDFKGSKSSIDFKKAEAAIDLVADDKFRMDAVWEILQTRLVRRGVPAKNARLGEVQPAAGGLVRARVALQQGIPTDTAKAIVKFLKDAKLKKVQASVQADQVRVTSSSKDDLQVAMRLLREQDFGIDLQFGNYRG